MSSGCMPVSIRRHPSTASASIGKNTRARTTCPASPRRGSRKRLPLRSFSQPAGVGFQPHQMLADRLEMLLAPPQLLRDRMDIAESPLEWVVVNDRRRAGRLIERVDDFDPGV